ncbi:MAG: SDR family NAD(P)-dependent oxidoreductase [Caldilineaceae bacterium]
MQGKVALVTGGARRIGRAITLMLAQAGAHVAVNYHQSAEAAYTPWTARACGVDAADVPVRHPRRRGGDGHGRRGDGGLARRTFWSTVRASSR